MPTMLTVYGEIFACPLFIYHVAYLAFIVQLDEMDVDDALHVDKEALLAVLDEPNKAALHTALNEVTRVPRDLSDLIYHYVEAIELCRRCGPKDYNSGEK